MPTSAMIPKEMINIVRMVLTLWLFMDSIEILIFSKKMEFISNCLRNKNNKILPGSHDFIFFNNLTGKGRLSLRILRYEHSFEPKPL